MIWPDHIRFISLPSLVFSSVFFWNGVVYLLFVFLLKRDPQARKKYFLFGMTSLALALYSFTTFLQYSATTLEVTYYWQRIEFVALIFFYVYFVLFVFLLLDIALRPWRVGLVLSVFSFLPLVFIPGCFITLQPAPKHLHLGPWSTTLM